MKIYTEVDLVDFEAWSGAVDTMAHLSKSELEKIEAVLLEIYPGGMEETTVNDFLWFETDYIAECLGYADWEELLAREDEIETGATK